MVSNLEHLNCSVRQLKSSWFFKDIDCYWCALGFPLNYESKSQLHKYKGCCKLISICLCDQNVSSEHSYTFFFIQDFHSTYGYHDMILQPYYYVVSTVILTQCICRSSTEKQGLHQDFDPNKLSARLRKLQKCQVFN